MKVLGKKSSKSDRALPRFPELSELSALEVAKLASHAELVEHHQRQKRTRVGAVKCAIAMGVSPATFYRRAARYKATGRVESMGRPRTSGGRGKSRLHPEVEAIIQKALRHFLRRKKRWNVVDLIADVEKALKERPDLPKPHNDTIRNRFKALSKRERYAHAEGREAARDKFDLIKGATPECTHPMERCQFDHTPGDIWVMSEDKSTRLGRPQVSMNIDEFSRIPVAIHVSLADPSGEEIAETVALASLPKEDWLDALGLDHINFPFFGIAEEYFLDKAAMHKSDMFRAACIARNIRLDLRKRTQDGGIIERLIGHAMVQSRKLPGSTIFSIAPRKEDQVDPSTTAEMTMKEYLRELIIYFWGYYTFEREHPALGMTPAQKWVMGLQTMAPRQVSDPFEFYLDFLPSHPATCQRYGVQVNHLRYSAPEFQSVVNDYLSEDIMVKIDPADVSRAFVRSPKDRSYIELFNADLAGKGITRSQWHWHVEQVRTSIPKGHRTANRRVRLKSILFHLETGTLLSDATKNLIVPPAMRPRKEVRREEHNDNLKARSAMRLPAPKTADAVAGLPAPLLAKLDFSPFELG